MESLSHTAASVGAQLQSWLAMQQYRLAVSLQDSALTSAVEDGRWALVCTVLAACAPDCKLSGSSVGSEAPLEACPMSGGNGPGLLSAPAVTASVIGKDARALGER